MNFNLINNLKLKIKNSVKGFTLVELLIVVAIIGVLSSLLMANFIGIRQRARDAQRKSDLRQIQSALEFYRSDLGYYPAAGTISCGGTLQNGATVYMKEIPCDPNSTPAYLYTPSGSPATSYTLNTCLENSSDTQLDSPNIARCSSVGKYSLTVTDP